MAFGLECRDASSNITFTSDRNLFVVDRVYVGAGTSGTLTNAAYGGCAVFATIAQGFTTPNSQYIYLGHSVDISGNNVTYTALNPNFNSYTMVQQCASYIYIVRGTYDTPISESAAYGLILSTELGQTVSINYKTYQVTESNTKVVTSASSATYGCCYVALMFDREYTTPPLVAINGASSSFVKSEYNSGEMLAFSHNLINASGRFIGVVYYTGTYNSPRSLTFPYRCYAPVSDVYNWPTDAYGLALYNGSNVMIWSSSRASLNCKNGIISYITSYMNTVTQPVANSWVITNSMIPQLFSQEAGGKSSKWTYVNGYAYNPTHISSPMVVYQGWNCWLEAFQVAYVDINWAWNDVNVYRIKMLALV